jgi:hypothetical protein
MSMAQLVVTAVLVEGRSKSEVAREYGVSRQWVITLVQRFLPRARRGWRHGHDDDAKLAALFDHRWQLAEMWATEDESRVEIVERYRRMWEHSDATIAALDIDAPGHVSWWPRPDVKLFNILVHVLNETNRHAGHADILREQHDGAVGTHAGSEALHGRDTTFWKNHRAKIERAAKAADPAQA